MTKLLKIAQGLEKLAVRSSYLEQLKAILINDYGWDRTLYKVIGRYSVELNLNPDKKADHAELYVAWSFTDKSAKYVYNPDEDEEEAADNINKLAHTLVVEDARERKDRQLQEISNLQMKRKKEKKEKQEDLEVKKTQKQYREKLKNNKIKQIKDLLDTQGWKYSMFLGYYKSVKNIKFWLTFSIDQIAIDSSIDKSMILDIGTESAEKVVANIDNVINHILEAYKEEQKVPYVTRETKLMSELYQIGWEDMNFEDNVIRATKKVAGSAYQTKIGLAFDIKSGRLNFSYTYDNNDTPIQILSWKLDQDKLKNLKETVKAIQNLTDSVLKRIYQLEAKRDANPGN